MTKCQIWRTEKCLTATWSRKFVLFNGLCILAENDWVKLATIQWSLFLLHCWSQVATIFTLNSDFFGELLLLNYFASTAMRKVSEKNGEHKLDEALLDVTKRNVRLEHWWFVPNFRNPRPRSWVIWNLKLSTSSAQPHQRKLTNVDHVVIIIPASVVCGWTHNWFMEHNVDQMQKVFILNRYSKKLTAIRCKKR